MSDDNGASITPAEAQRVVNELYRRYQEASPYPLDGKRSERNEAYNRLGNVCHRLGLPNPADDEEAAARSERDLSIDRIIENTRKGLLPQVDR